MRTFLAMAGAIVAVCLAAPAHADDSIYLELMHSQYFTRAFTDGQLLAEGHKVCDYAGRYSDDALEQMVIRDMAVSAMAAQTLVIYAHSGLGC